MATLTEIITVLKAVKRGSEYYACCPAHADSKPSLSITEKRGMVHVFCHAGCTQQRVTEELRRLGLWGKDGTNHAYTDDTIARRRERIVKPVCSPRGPRTATYDYTDESGTLLYQVLRFEPGQDGAKKDFMQRQPDNTRADGWRYNLAGVRPVLYHLPEVIDSHYVILVEGEKDVETLRSYGFVASTGAGGSRSWRPEYAGMLSGKRVLVIPDADAPGELWLATVGADLPNAELVRLPAKDVTEWFGQGHTREELERMIR